MLRSFRQVQARALIVCGIAASLQLVACAETGPHATQDSASASDLVRCTEPRPEICTQEYRPVCALLNDGSERTYASGCVACADARVLGYRPDPCE
jgi:hypothetical protein